MSEFNAPNSSRPPRPVATPCIQVCTVDGASGLCLGCWRTLSEIGGWSALGDADRAAILAALPGRERAAAARGQGSLEPPSV